MTAAEYNLRKVEAGTTWQLYMTLKNDSGNVIDLTGYSARMKVRPTADSPTVLVSLTSGSGITLGGTFGTIVVDRSATQTALYRFKSGVYDLEMESGTGVVTRLLEGVFVVSPEVTR